MTTPDPHPYVQLGKRLHVCRHCPELVCEGPTGGWIDRDGWLNCQKGLAHEPMPEELS